MAINYNGDIAVVLDSQHRTPGNLRAFVQASIRSIKTGKSSDVRFSSTEKIEVVPMMTRKMEFSYKDGEDFVFSDPETYETVNLPPELVGDAKNYLVENAQVTMTFVEEKAVSIELPSSVVLTVTDAPEGIRGDSANNVQKPVDHGDGHHGAGAVVHQDGREAQDRHPHRASTWNGRRGGSEGTAGLRSGRPRMGLRRGFLLKNFRDMLYLGMVLDVTKPCGEESTWKSSHKYPQRRLRKRRSKTERMKRGMNKTGRRIFGPATSLFVGHSPILGMLPPHVSWPTRNLRPRHLRLFMRWLPSSILVRWLKVVALGCVLGLMFAFLGSVLRVFPGMGGKQTPPPAQAERGFAEAGIEAGD